MDDGGGGRHVDAVGIKEKNPKERAIFITASEELPIQLVANTAKTLLGGNEDEGEPNEYETTERAKRPAFETVMLAPPALIKDLLKLPNYPGPKCPW